MKEYLQIRLCPKCNQYKPYQSIMVKYFWPEKLIESEQWWFLNTEFVCADCKDKHE